MSQARVLGLLPARGGSKGVPGKNLRLLAGKPLIAWAAEALAKAKIPSRKIVSTDDPLIADAAKKSGLEIPWLRPEEFATDTSPVVDVIEHALLQLKTDHDESYTHVALVQATSPTVSPEDIDAAISLAVEGDADTVITGFPAGQRHPSTMYSLKSDNEVDWLFEDKQRMARRQDLPSVYIRTGLVYIIRTELILNKKTVYGDRILALTISEERSLTIDEEQDFRLAEFQIKQIQNLGDC
jgi:CMP-N,N'-diacetyllegionaminic acid synthase